MKIQKSYPISPFGGLNFVIEEFNKQKISNILDKQLPVIATQSKYCWKDIFYSYWSIFFCGGDCAEDLGINFSNSFNRNPFLSIPSPDRVLNRLKELAEPILYSKAERGKVLHEISYNQKLSSINLKILKQLNLLKSQDLTLDYDNTILFSKKADAQKTYKGLKGYVPGVGLIGKNVVYVENRNGNSDAQTLQHETLLRMFKLLNKEGIKIKRFRADSASYQLLTISVICSYAENLYVKARKDEAILKVVSNIEEWEEINEGSFRGEIDFIPFQTRAKYHKREHLLKSYRLVVTKTINSDGQINIFTGEACNYDAILTNDREMTTHEIVHFYNQRGAAEKEFDILKNDFGWKNLPFSKLEQNTVFLLFTAICRNLYHYIINIFSLKFKNLSKEFRIKKFIYRFICIPAKWIKTARTNKLKLYGEIYFKT